LPQSKPLLDYDGTKRLSRFLWEVLSGFDFVTGYQKDDIIEKMIESIAHGGTKRLQQPQAPSVCAPIPSGQSFPLGARQVS
jgi:hypothetical protein